VHDGSVQKTDQVEGVAYLLRAARPAKEDPACLKVSYIGPCRGRQARVRHEMGDLVEWVPSRMIVVRWTERKALQKDEERATTPCGGGKR
jgi:hypothetical protein